MSLAVDGLSSSQHRKDGYQAFLDADAGVRDAITKLYNGTIAGGATYTSASATAPNVFGTGTGAYGYYYTVGPTSDPNCYLIDSYGLASNPRSDAMASYVEALVLRDSNGPPGAGNFGGTYSVSWGDARSASVNFMYHGESGAAINGNGGTRNIPPVTVDTAMAGSTATMQGQGTMTGNPATLQVQSGIKSFNDQLIAALDLLTPKTIRSGAAGNLSTCTVGSPGAGSPFFLVNGARCVPGGPWGAAGAANNVIVTIKPPGPGVPTLPLFSTDSAAFYGILYLDLSNITTGTWPTTFGAGNNLVSDSSSGFQGVIVIKGPKIQLGGTLVYSSASNASGGIVLELNATQTNSMELTYTSDNATSYGPAQVSSAFGALESALTAQGNTLYSIISYQQKY
jgi:hypothetical protein